MYCKNCGKELKLDDKFCSNCGASVETVVYQEQQTLVYADEDKGPYKVFAIIGFVLGFVGILLSILVAFLPVMCIIPLSGLILSIIGVLSKNHKGKAITGIVLNSIDCFISAVMIWTYIQLVGTTLG